MRFEWDKTKSKANERKHGVGFDEATTVFYDDDALLFDDPDHSDNEDRFLLFGLSSKARALVVVHCERQDGGVIRIISAREATARERAVYGGKGDNP